MALTKSQRAKGGAHDRIIEARRQRDRTQKESNL
jgi:hypothetical protein